MARGIQVYIGPYLKMQLKKTSVPRSVTCCENVFCKYFNRDTQWNFCSECGNATVKKTSWEQRFFYYNDLDLEKTHHGLPEKDVDLFAALLYDCVLTLRQDEQILLPNQSKYEKSLWPGVVSSASFEQSLDNLDAPLAVQRFEEEHKEALETFRAKLGSENIETKFGLIAFE